MKKFEEVERLAHRGRHREALALLETIPRENLSKNELAYYHILRTEASVIVGDIVPSQEVDNAIEVFRYDPDTAKFARAKYAKGLWFVGNADYSNAQETLMEAYTGFLRCQELFHAARALNRLAYLSLQQGDVRSAMDGLEKAIEIHRRLDNFDAGRRFSINLSLMYVLTGQLRDAESLCRELDEHFEVLSTHSKIILLMSSGMAKCLKGNCVGALETLNRCKPYLEEYPRQGIFYYQYLGWAYLSAKDYDAAENSLIAGLSLATDKNVTIEGTTIRRLLADVCVATGRFKEAKKHAQEVLTHIQKTNERGEIAACYRIFGRLEHNSGSLNKARYWFDKAMEMFDHILSRYQLAVTRCLAAGCKTYSAEEKAYLLTLAREYFALENVEHRVIEIERELKSLHKSASSKTLSASRRHPAGSGIHSECPTIITKDTRMKELLDVTVKVAPSDITVFLTGPTGSGKDMIARYIHYHSGRSGQFVSVNAAAVPDSMVESELFGHARGAFTGAELDKAGMFEAADNGTFYLNEIADATSSFQAKLLEVIETRKVRRLGENKHLPVNFRLVAATNHDLKQRIEEGLFRSDLFHRLNEISIELPPLCERTGDIQQLLEHFLRTSGFDSNQDGDPDSINRLAVILARREWPGNVRQLRAEINRLLLTSNRNLKAMIELADETAAADPHQALLDALDAAGGNKSKAARALGIKESTLRYRLKKCQTSRHRGETD